MPYTDTQKKASEKWIKEHTDDVRLRVPKGTKDRWKKYAESHGMSMTSFVCQKINEIVEE